MIKYHKINSLWKRDLSGKILSGCWSQDEFPYLQDNRWNYTEKIDGVNIRVTAENGTIIVRGRTDNAQIHPDLYKRIVNLFYGAFDRMGWKGAEKFTFFGEGIGPKIQGNKYQRDHDFILFDILYQDRLFLKKRDIENMASSLGLPVTKLLGSLDLEEIVDYVATKPQSNFGPCTMEGVVAVPMVELCGRRGERIITKIKVCDVT